MKIRNTVCHLLAAASAVAAFQLTHREATLKLADQVMVCADCSGFAELAATHPWGVIDWLMRLLAATNLIGWGVIPNLVFFIGAGMLATCALRRCKSSLAPFAPWFAAALFILPTLSLGEQVWHLPCPHFPQLHLFLFAVLAGCLTAGRIGFALFAALQLLLVAIGLFGYDDLPAFETLRAAWSLPLQFGWDVRSVSVIAAFIGFASAVFVKRPAVWPKWANALAPALVMILAAIAWPRRDCRDQLRMEAAVRDARFEDVLGIAPRKKRPERMETAWRILAMFRTDRIDRDLYRYPITGSHQNTDEMEMIMEGPLLLFHYGLVLTARFWTFEVATTRGWRPQDFRLLGDIALVTGEGELARKNFQELARCPFRGDFAERRLRALRRKPPMKKDFADLTDVAECYGAWCNFAKNAGFAAYIGEDILAERIVYGNFLKLKSCPPKMLKMLFASALLEGRPDLISGNWNALRKLYPDGRIGPAFLEALK